MRVFLHSQKIVSPLGGESRGTRHYALNDVAYKQVNGAQVVDLRHSSIVDWTGTESLAEFEARLVRVGFEVHHA